MTVRILRRPPAPHFEVIKKNMREINRLLGIHKEISGEGPGYKHNVQVLNKSALVLLLACWEAYVEDLAENCFDVMLDYADDPTVFPEHVLAIAVKELKKADTLAIWGLSKDGWRRALKSHKQRILDKYVAKGSFNTPSAANVDRLFSELIGLTSLSSQWFWKGSSKDMSQQRLADLIELRGTIAHRVDCPTKVTKTMVVNYKKLINRLAVISHNRALALIYARTDKKPWGRYRAGKTT